MKCDSEKSCSLFCYYMDSVIIMIILLLWWTKIILSFNVFKLFVKYFLFSPNYYIYSIKKLSMFTYFKIIPMIINNYMVKVYVSLKDKQDSKMKNNLVYNSQQ